MTGFLGALASGYAQALVNIAVQVAMVPLYLRYMGGERFGLLTLYLAAINYLAIGYLWASGGMTRLLGETYAVRDEARFALVYAVGKRVALGYAALFAVLGGGALMLWAPNNAPVTALMALYLLATYLFSIDRLALNARGRQTEANLLTMASQLVFAALAVPALLLGFDLAGVAAALCIGQLVAQALTWVAKRRLDLTLTWSAGDRAARGTMLRAMVSRRGAGFVVFGALTLSLQADALILGWLAPLTTVASFALIWKVAEAGAQLLARVPDTLQPYLIHHDARADRAALAQAYRRVLLWSWIVGPLAGLGFALVGPWLVALWVGVEHAPTESWAYWAAGGAVMWLTVSRPPLITAFALVRLRPLVTIQAIELAGKLLLIALLVAPAGYAAPMLAINLTHALGVAWAYQWLGRRLTRTAT